jgi:hypothetical protein
MIIIIANILGLISALIMIYAGSIKEKNKVLKYHTIHAFFGMSCDLLLGGYPSVISNIFTITRNILVNKNKFNKIYMIIFILLVTILILLTNNLGWIGYIPLINFIFYTVFINTKDNIIFKYVFIISMITWLIYDIIIKAYSSAIFDFITIVTAIITLISMKKGNKKKTRK